MLFSTCAQLNWGRGGGTADFWSHSFHATPLGLMLKCQNQRGARCPGALPVPPPMNKKAKSEAFWKNEYAPQRPITTTFQWVKPTGTKSIMALNDSTNLLSLFVEVYGFGHMDWLH